MRQEPRGLEGLRALRRAAGFTQQAMADALGITRQVYAMYESCAVWPSAKNLPKMAELLHCGMEELFQAQAAADDSETAES